MYMKATGKQWVLKPPNIHLAHQIAQENRISPITAQCLINRNITTAQAIRGFLEPSLRDLYSVYLLEQTRQAVDRIRKALQKNEAILIYGDYDVDGLCSTVILYNLFSKVYQRQPRYYIPSRFQQGYGLNLDVLKKFIEEGVKVVICVDCGTTDINEVEFLTEKGVDVIVIDHHYPAERLPSACAILNPLVPGCSYPFKELASCGVAFKFSWALTQDIVKIGRISQELKDFYYESLAYVALGTIADAVPLVSENRILVTYGLDAIANSRNIAIRHLLHKTGLGRSFTVEDLSMRIIPLLNAAGRMQDASLCIELLTCESEQEVEQMIDSFMKLNRKRQDIERGVYQQAYERAIKEDTPAIVLWDREWHIGVLGIVASRLMEEMGRPVFLFKDEGKIAKGSARADEQFNLIANLMKMRDMFLDVGGHPGAAGMCIYTELLPEFKRTMIKIAGEYKHSYLPKINVDCQLELSYITPLVAKEAEKFAPYGYGNSPPTFLASKVKIVSDAQFCGRNMQDMVFLVRQGDCVMEAQIKGMSHLWEKITPEQFCSIVFNITTHKGLDTPPKVILDVVDIHFD